MPQLILHYILGQACTTKGVLSPKGRSESVVRFSYLSILTTLAKAGDRIRTDDIHVGNVTLYH